MTNISVLENKISAVRKYLQVLKRYQEMNFSEIANDVDKRGAVERYLYLVSQATIDLADAMVSYKKLRKPLTMGETFHILQAENLIDDELADKMIKMTGFRNVIAHDYDKVNYEIVENVLRNGLKDVEKFAKKIEESI